MILYHFLKNKPINGTLFYCFEYFVFLNKYKDTEYWIYDISENQLNKIKNIFIERYDFDHKLLDKIKIARLKSFCNVPETCIILDNRTYRYLRSLIKTKVLWHNTESKVQGVFYPPKKDVDTTFGSYDYQDYEIYQHLQFNFEIYKKIDKSENKIFISCPERDIEETIKILKEKNIFINRDNIYLKHSNHISNTFERFNTFIYIHTTFFDRNHRMLIESFYYNKNIILIDDYKNDSVFIRYNELQEKGINYFNLTKENKLIKAYLDN